MVSIIKHSAYRTMVSKDYEEKTIGHIFGFLCLLTRLSYVYPTYILRICYVYPTYMVRN